MSMFTAGRSTSQLNQRVAYRPARSTPRRLSSDVELSTRCVDPRVRHSCRAAPPSRHIRFRGSGCGEEVGWRFRDSHLVPKQFPTSSQQRFVIFPMFW